MSNFFANPYSRATGFFFGSLEELQNKTENWRDRSGAPVEEWSVEFVDGQPGDSELFKAAAICQANIDRWFDDLEDLDESERAALFFLLVNLGYKLDDAMDKIEDCCLTQGEIKEAAAERFDERFLDGIPEGARAYIDYDAWARDCELNGEMHEFEFAGKTWTCTNSDAL